MTTVTNESFPEKIWDDIKDFFAKQGPVVKSITAQADALVNEFKNLEESTVGQFLESGIEAIIPASTGLINAVHIALPIVCVDLNWAVNEEGKSDALIITDALAYLAQLKTKDPVLYAGALNTLSTKIGTILSGDKGLTLTTEQSLLLSPIAHNPNIVNTAA